MPRFTGEQLKEQFQKDPKGISHMLGARMSDRCYPNVTDESVETEINRQLAGKEPSNLSYGLWVQVYLREGVDQL